MKPTVLGIVIVLALIAAGAIFFASDAFAPHETANVEQTYASDLLGISFSYPTGYLLSESNNGDDHYSISIVSEADAVPRVNSEGPTAITIDAYGSGDAVPLKEWVMTSEASNYRLGDQELAETTVAGQEALSYRWSGLYEGETTAFVSGGRIIAVSVTYMSPADQIYADYLGLLASLRVRP